MMLVRVMQLLLLRVMVRLLLVMLLLLLWLLLLLLLQWRRCGSDDHGGCDFLNVFEKVGVVGGRVEEGFVQLVLGGVGSSVFVAARRRRGRRFSARRFIPASASASASLLLLVLAVQLVDLLLLLLLLHSPVLEPDFDLPLGEAEGVGDLDASSARQVFVETVFFLQLECLMTSVSLTTTVTSKFGAWREEDRVRQVFDYTGFTYTLPRIK